MFLAKPCADKTLRPTFFPIFRNQGWPQDFINLHYHIKNNVTAMPYFDARLALTAAANSANMSSVSAQPTQASVMLCP